MQAVAVYLCLHASYFQPYVLLAKSAVAGLSESSCLTHLTALTVALMKRGAFDDDDDDLEDHGITWKYSPQVSID